MEITSYFYLISSSFLTDWFWFIVYLIVSWNLEISGSIDVGVDY